MKVIEKIITYEDYNYVEGSLQFKAYGQKTHNLLHAEYFSIDRISHVQLEVEKKYLPPQLPPGINKNKVSTLTLPDKIITIVGGDYSKPYAIIYDEVIVDDSFVDEHQNIKGPRFNSTKTGSELSSTVAIKVYGLLKIERQRTESENQYEITVISHGPGRIEVSPLKESYGTGEKVTVKPMANEKSMFVGYRNEYEYSPQEFEIQIGEEDVTIEADFINIKEAKEILSSNQGNPVSNKRLETIKNGYDRITSEENRSYPERLKENWKNKSVTNKSLGIEAYGFWEIVGLIFSTLFYIAILVFLIAIFKEGILVIGIIILAFWLLNLISSYIFNWRGFQWIVGLVFFLFILTGSVKIIQNFENYSQRKREWTDSPKIETQEIANENTTIDYIHHLAWNDYDKNRYEIDLIINSDLVKKANIFKDNHPSVNTESSYSMLLSNLYQTSMTDDYVRVKEKLDSIQQVKNMNRKEFANVIVSMIQTIPYFAIVEESCNPYSYQDPAVRQLLLQKPCQPYIRFGIKAPAEFLMDLKGDCDTRTLFLYGLLKSFGYDVAIFGSQKYKHSVLGIVLDIERPHYKLLNNKEYYLWEVTEKEYRPGLLPIQIANLNYWNINLN